MRKTALHELMTAGPGTTKRARRAAPPIRGFAGAWMARLARATRYVDPKLMEQWPSLIGDELASLCRPGRLSGGRRDRTLEIFVTNGAAAAAVRFEESRMILSINEFLGPGVVGRLTIRQSGGAPSNAERTPGQRQPEQTQNENASMNAPVSAPESASPPRGLSRFRNARPPGGSGKDRDDDVPF